MAKPVRRSQSKKTQTPRSKKTLDYRNGNSLFNFKNPRYTRHMKYNSVDM